MRKLLRENARFFLAWGAVALTLRLSFVFLYPANVDDSRLYANIAENWLRHGIYGITNSGVIMPTLSRLPGYPAFLALIFTIFGMDSFGAVLLVQVLFDLVTCLLIADISRRMFSARTAKLAFALAAVCPFFANYAATMLTETLEIFFTALALYFAVKGLGLKAVECPEPELLSWLWAGFAIGGGILLRPDGGILLAAVGAYLAWLVVRSFLRHEVTSVPRWIIAGILLTLGATLPLVPWTVRNLHTFHRFQPLAPRYANDSDEPLMPGFNRWVKTWTAEYVSVEDIYWNVPGEEIDLDKLPKRAFDTPEQKAMTADLFARYNQGHDMNPDLDSRFGTLAAERIHAAPLRYYLWLPVIRIADMWLRPRTELFPADPRWWEFNDDHRWLTVSIAFGAINLLYVLLAAAGLMRARELFGIGLFVLFLVLRSAFLGTLENPEPRYTLECYPAVILLASAIFHTRE